MIKALIILHVLFMLFGSIWLMHKDYDLPEKDVKNIAKDSIVLKKYLWNGNNVDPVAIRDDFHKKFPYILSAANFPPLQIKTGGLFGQVHLLYASLTEILVIYHFPLRTSGDSGRHFMNISVTVLQGKVSSWSMKTPITKEYLPSNCYSYKIGERQFVAMEQDSYILVHGRGLVPLSLWYSIADSIFSSCDPPSALLAASYYMRAVYSNWNVREYFTDAYTFAWTTANRGLQRLPQAFDTVRDVLVNMSRRVYQQGRRILDAP